MKDLQELRNKDLYFEAIIVFFFFTPKDILSTRALYSSFRFPVYTSPGLQTNFETRDFASVVVARKGSAKGGDSSIEITETSI